MSLVDGAAAAAAAAGGAVTREGGNTTEATTTSTTTVDLLTASSLTVAAAQVFVFMYNGRKTTGNASRAAGGLKINTTQVAQASATQRRGWLSTSTDQAENGSAWCNVPARITDYDRPAQMQDKSHTSSPVTSNVDISLVWPVAEITDVVIQGIVANAAVTLALDELHVYSLATS